MSYLIELQEKLRPVIREVFLRDPCFERFFIVRTNKDARLFLRHIIQYGKRAQFNLKISYRQLAKMIGSPRVRYFIQWFRYNARRPAEFYRARRFLNEIIEINAREDLRLWNPVENVEVEKKHIEWPTVEQKLVWARRINDMREARAIEGPRIKNKIDAMETLNSIQDAFLSETSSVNSCSSSSSFEDSEDKIVGEYVSDGHQIEEEMLGSIESLVLCEPSVGVTNKELLDEFTKEKDTCDEIYSIANGTELSFSAVCEQFNQ